VDGGVFACGFSRFVGGSAGVIYACAAGRRRRLCDCVLIHIKDLQFAQHASAQECASRQIRGVNSLHSKQLQEIVYEVISGDCVSHMRKLCIKSCEEIVY